MPFTQDEIRVSLYKDSSPKVTMTILHYETGITVHGETGPGCRSEHVLRQNLLEKLEMEVDAKKKI